MAELTSHFKKAREDIDNIKKKCMDIVNVEVIQTEYCLQTFPCQGHKGVYLVCSNGKKIPYACSSVSIGCIQRVFLGDLKVSPHFKKYTEGFVYY